MIVQANSQICAFRVQCFKTVNYLNYRKAGLKAVENDASVRLPKLSLASWVLDLWPPDPKADCFNPFMPICIQIDSFVFKISCSQSNRRTDGRTDGQTNGQLENIMPLPASLAWRRLNVLRSYAIRDVQEWLSCTHSLPLPWLRSRSHSGLESLLMTRAKNCNKRSK